MAQADAAVEVTEVRIAATHERIRVIAETRKDIAIDGAARHTRTGSSLTLEPTGGRLTVRVPEGTGVVIGTTSSRVDVEGASGVVAITTESGRISVEAAEAVDARTVSGRIDLGLIDGNCRAQSENGRINVKSCADADVATTNGRIDLEAASGIVRAHCVNGRISIDMSAAGDVFAETVNGRINVSLPSGVRALQLSEATADADREGFDCLVVARSATGKVSVETR
jgi:DUF4097 and DUF4098 domain-containing protein YvlB